MPWAYEVSQLCICQPLLQQRVLVISLQLTVESLPDPLVYQQAALGSGLNVEGRLTDTAVVHISESATDLRARQRLPDPGVAKCSAMGMCRSWPWVIAIGADLQ